MTGGAGPTADDLAVYVEHLGAYFESSGLPRLAGRMLAHLVVCEPAAQSSEELARALGASSGGVSTNVRLLITSGLIDRFGRAGDRRTFYRLRPHAFDMSVRERSESMARLRQLADEGTALLGDTPGGRGERLREMGEVAEFMEIHAPRLFEEFRAERRQRDG